MRRLTQEQALKKCYEAHQDKYDYSRFTYKNKRTKAEIICRVHGSFWQTPSAHFFGQHCPKCAYAERGFDRRVGTPQFILDSEEVHGDKYDYSLVEYICVKDPVAIICKEHGIFYQTPSDHKNGRGCPDCAKTGYRVSKEGKLYILQHEDCLKVGITNRDIKRRVSEINNSSSRKFSVLSYFVFSDGRVPLMVETQLLKELRSNYKQPQEQFNGSTECFLNADYPHLVERVGKIASEILIKLNIKE